jgi:MSHA biogenesis protein MshG
MTPMARFRYQARSAAGDLLEGRLEAASAEAVADQLLVGGATPVRIVEEAAARSGGGGLRLQLGGNRVAPDDLILFCRQMYSLIRSGVPLLRALRGMVEMAGKPIMAETLQAVLDDLEGGHHLSGALGRHPRVFPPLVVSMIQVGESSGRLEDAFQEISIYLEREKKTADQIKAALRYPTFVVTAIAIAIAILTLFVIPAFQKLYAGAGVQLPLPTRIILGISNFAVHWWWAVLLCLVAAFFGWRGWINTPPGRLRWDGWKLRLPVIGSIIHRAILVRFARGFAMGYGAGVPLLQSLALTARAVGNSFVQQCLDKMRTSVERGDTLTRGAAISGMFTPLVLQMLAVGEESGAIDRMLLEVADFYEREIEYEISRLSSAIEPILIVIIGGMVLVLALGVFLPMWNMAAAVRGGG